jgi:hypothetical protein
MSPAFCHYIGIDYSGAETPTSSLKGLLVYHADIGEAPTEVLPPPSSRKYWTRRGVAEWLVAWLSEKPATMVGTDHGFSFPLRYFEAHGLKPDWPAFLDDFQRHWPTDDDHTYVDFVREGICGNGAARMGNARWRRLTEERSGRAKSVFHFDVQGSSQNQPMRGFHGCGSSGSSLDNKCISGRSTAGIFLPDTQPSQKSTRHCGAAARPGTQTSTMPTASQLGFPVPTATTALLAT